MKRCDVHSAVHVRAISSGACPSGAVSQCDASRADQYARRRRRVCGCEDGRFLAFAFSADSKWFFRESSQFKLQMGASIYPPIHPPVIFLSSHPSSYPSSSILLSSSYPSIHSSILLSSSYHPSIFLCIIHPSIIHPPIIFPSICPSSYHPLFYPPSSYPLIYPPILLSSFCPASYHPSSINQPSILSSFHSFILYPPIHPFTYPGRCVRVCVCACVSKWLNDSFIVYLSGITNSWNSLSFTWNSSVVGAVATDWTSL